MCAQHSSEEKGGKEIAGAKCNDSPFRLIFLLRCAASGNNAAHAPVLLANMYVPASRRIGGPGYWSEAGCTSGFAACVSITFAGRKEEKSRCSGPAGCRCEQSKLHAAALHHIHCSIS